MTWMPRRNKRTFYQLPHWLEKTWRYWARILQARVTVRPLRSQTVKLVRYGRGGNKFRRTCYVAV
jgi:hypothetical protein